MNIPDPLFFDSFLFNGEDIVKLRLEYLNPYVDHFYITESIFTFSGMKKKEYYIDACSEWFRPYLHKITFLKIDTKLETITPGYPTGDSKIDTMLRLYDSFKEEAAQRNFVRQRILQEYPDSSRQYCLAVADVDEIYDVRTLGSKKILWHALHDSILYFQQKNYMFNFLYQAKDDICVAMVINSEMMKEHSNLNKLRNEKFGEKSIVIQSGWHFSFFMKKEEIQRKLQSYSHIDVNTPKFTDLYHIDTQIRKGQDLLLRDSFILTNKEYADPSNNFPEVFYPYFLTLCSHQGISPYTVSKIHG
jgi:beta-1,4-mannosyl-glycoprotein beta-1,4-N-acetylglucosaminyltransferase